MDKQYYDLHNLLSNKEYTFVIGKRRTHMDYQDLHDCREKEVKTIAKYCGQILGLKKDYSVTYNPYGKIWYIHLIGYGNEYERVTIFEHELYDKSHRELIEIICHEAIHSRILKINP